MKHVKDIIAKQNLISTSPDATVLDTVRKMTEEKIGAVPVIKGSGLVGIFTERDVMTRVVSRELSPGETAVAEVMSADVHATATPDDLLPDCIERMQKSGVRHLPVLEGETVVGVISLRDLLQMDRMEIRHEKEILSELATENPIYDV